jgi:hypothetical protein
MTNKVRILRAILTVGSLMLLIFSINGIGQGVEPFEEGLTLQKKKVSSGVMGQGAQSSTGTMYFGKGFLREVSSDGEEYVIFLDEGRFITIDHNKKTYAEMTFQELEDKLAEVSARVSEESAEHQQAVEMMRKMMGGKMGEVSLERKGPGEEIAGFSTEKYLLVMPPLEMEIWAAPDLKVPPVYYDTLKMQVEANPFFDMGKMFELFKQIDGLSLKTEVIVEMMGTKSTSTDEVTEVKTGPVPDPAIPQGYEKVEEEF